jgi:hypothetical protein
MKKFRKLIAMYLIRLTFYVLPKGELTNDYKNFLYKQVLKQMRNHENN